MKIAQIVSTFWPYFGGMGNVARFFSEYLSSRGHEVTVITPQYKNKKNLISENPFSFEIQRIQPIMEYGNAAYLASLGQYLRQYDIIHFHYPFFGGLEPLFFYRLRPNQKLVITYHMEFVPSSLFLKLASIPSLILRESLFRRAHRITVSSFDYVAHSRDKGLYEKNPDKWVELPFGFNPLFSRETIPSKHESVSKSPFVLFVGGLDQAHSFKGIPILLEAWKYVNLANLIIVGDGDRRLAYIQKVLDLGLRDRVIFTGKIPDEELQSYYRDCSCLVLPSTGSSEAFGLVAVNAMAAGKPVVASNLPGVRTVVDDGITGFLVKPGDSRDLSLKLNELLGDSDLQKQMGNHAYLKAREKYDWPVIIDHLESLYL